MASRTVDVVALAPPSADPYAPGAAAWGLAAALAERGDRVRVVFPGPEDGAPAPPGVEEAPVELALRRPGAAVEAAELAGAAARRLRPEVELVLRDPIGLGRLGLRRSRGTGPLLAGFVRGLELDAFDRSGPSGSPTGIRDRLDRWLDRRAIRRLEAAALAEADRLFYDTPGVPALLKERYAIPESRCRVALPAVARLPDAPSTEDARAAWRIPPDVPVVAAPAAFEQAEPSGIDRAREAFRRVRSFFPGARLIVTGASAPAEAHVTVAPERDGTTLARALAAADVAVFARRLPGFDPGVVHALRAGRSAIVGPGVRLPVEPGEALRALPGDDAGEFASVLAELLADPAARRPLASAGERYAAQFDPARVAAGIAEATRPGGA
ncbi:MAG TPA: hypothetical protein VEL82_03480 [Thermoplasmata archaeon]|nr:hypothetical protein [Thermoplasmata archaeon]